MKRVNENTFVEIITTATLSFSSDCFYSDDEENISHCLAYNELSADGINITFEVGYKHPPYHPTELEISNTYDWNFNEFNIEVIDENNVLLDNNELIELIDEHTNMRTIDWSLLGLDQFDELDPDEDIDDFTQYEEISLRRDGYPNLKFKGRLLASFSNGDCYSATRWIEHQLYQTINEEYVCVTIHDSLIDVERAQYNAAHFLNLSDIVGFFGISETTIKLYEKIGLKYELLSV